MRCIPFTYVSRLKLACFFSVESSMIKFNDLAEFKQAYPSAKLLGVPDHLSKPSLRDLKFDGGTIQLLNNINTTNA